MYVIIGASGNTGSRIARTLLENGKAVKVIGRSSNSLKELGDLGARVEVGNLEDGEFLQRALAGATAVYAMIPPNFSTPVFLDYQKRVADNLTTAIRENGIRYVVALSSIGAQFKHDSGVVKGHHYFENQLNSLEDVQVLHLRAGFFFENLLGNIGLLKGAGFLAGFPIRGDQPMAFVHTRDIAAKAAGRLLALDFTGKNVEFVAGPKEYTLNEVTRIIGKAIGNEGLQWVAFSYDEAGQGMQQAGILPDLAAAYIEFSALINSGRFLDGFVRDASNTTPTTAEEFAETDFAPAYRAFTPDKIPA